MAVRVVRRHNFVCVAHLPSSLRVWVFVWLCFRWLSVVIDRYNTHTRAPRRESLQHSHTQAYTKHTRHGNYHCPALYGCPFSSSSPSQGAPAAPEDAAAAAPGSTVTSSCCCLATNAAAAAVWALVDMAADTDARAACIRLSTWSRERRARDSSCWRFVRRDMSLVVRERLLCSANPPILRFTSRRSFRSRRLSYTMTRT